jgi:hypothetical protein
MLMSNNASSKHQAAGGWHVLAALGLLACGASAHGRTIENDVFWKDTGGRPIFSQGGGMIKVKDTYYWYGVNYPGAATYLNNGTAGSGLGFRSVTCYSSTDLANWKFEGDALARDQVGGGWFGRLGVVYNAKTKKYVMIAQGSGPGRGGGMGEYFATSDTPIGPFKFDNVQDVSKMFVNGNTGDQTTFQDDDGKAYVIASNIKGRSHLYVAPLRESDFLALDSAKEISSGKGREGNCMFKYNGKYYFCSSDLHGWNSSPTYYITATNILGPYSRETRMTNSELDFSHVTQTGFFFNVNGTKQTTVVFAGDRWSDFGGNGIGYNQWVPISFEKDQPVFNSLSQWELDAKTGEWKVGLGNNYILNPSFEADRVAQRTLAGWTRGQGGDTNANSKKGESHSGNFAMQQSGNAAYTASLSQNITLPNGTYTLNAWVKSSGGQNTAVIAVKDFGAADKTVSLARALGTWTQVTISEIKVTNGKCQVAILSDAKAGNWIQVDDLSLVNSAAPKAAAPVKTGG